MDEVRARQYITCVAFEFDGKSYQFRKAFISMTSDGLFLKFNIAGNKRVRFKLSSDVIMSKDELLWAMSSIKDLWNLHEDNEEDIEKIIEALSTSARKEIALNNSDQIYRLIEAADKCRKEIVLCLLGRPGIGKTEAVERFAKDHGRKVVHIIASQILPSEVSGMTMPNQETHSMDVFDHYRLSHMKDGDILFFDELLKGQQQVLNACLTLIQERRLMSGAKLPDVLVIAAANPLATPLQLPLEIRQRFMFVNVEWKKQQWIEYMKALGFDDGKFLFDLSCKVEAMLGKDDAWNTLTPRTATKLCLWLRDSGNDLSVRGFIMKSFGSEVLKMVSDTVFGSEVKSREVQTAERIIEILTPIYTSSGSRQHTDVDQAMEAAKAVANEETRDITELLSKLQALPEWGEIQKMLAASTLEEDKIEF